MRWVPLLISFFASYSTMAQNGKAFTTKKTFSRVTSISTDIKADTSVIWALLTNVSEFQKWNSTVISIEGEIKLGEKIKLKSSLDPNRTFKLRIKEMVPNQQLTWGDAMGTRIYILKPINNGTRFTMTEKIGGLMFPLFANKIPSFDKSFEQFADDLKRTAESSK